MNKIISFSLYGTDPKYYIGAIENVKQCKKYYPEWTCQFYVSQEITSDIVNRLKQYGAKVIHKVREDEVDGTFWRFLPMSDDNLDALIVRDVDSRISKREVEAVNEWLNSGKSFHIMRDHPGHIILIPAGLFGIRGGIVKNINNLIENWAQKREKSHLGWADQYGLDQLFLAQVIYPKIKSNVLIHTDLIKFKDETVCAFPTKRKNNEFVGDIININSQTLTNNLNLDKIKIKIYPDSKYYYSPFWNSILNVLRSLKKIRRGLLN